MRVKFVENTVAQRQVVEAGTTMDLPDGEAIMLIQMGRAVPVAKVATEVAERATVEAPEKRGRKPKAVK